MLSLLATPQAFPGDDAQAAALEFLFQRLDLGLEVLRLRARRAAAGEILLMRRIL